MTLLIASAGLSEAPFVSKVFGADLQGPANPVEGIAFAAPVPESVLLNPAADLSDRGRFELHDVESVQDCDGSGQFVADGVGVAAERGPATWNGPHPGHRGCGPTRVALS